MVGRLGRGDAWVLQAVRPGSPCPLMCQLWVRRSGTAAGGLPQTPLLAQDHVLVNFNSHTVEKHTVQATRGAGCTWKQAPRGEGGTSPAPGRCRESRCTEQPGEV